MFIKDHETVSIKIYFKQLGYRFLALTDGEIKKRIQSNQLTESQVESDFKNLTVEMEILSWGTYNQYQDQATEVDSKGDRHFNYKTYKEMRLKNLIKGWDAVGEDGKGIPVDQKNIMRLAPAIGDAIVRAYDEESFYDEEMEKN